jgi:ubiquinone/menaquinone biosynthesis C-methylase UbiE
MIEFLETARYTGADISSGCLQRARDCLQSKGLMEKSPTLVHLPGGDLSALRGKKFDFIWAQSVLTHMPPDNVSELLREIPLLLKKGGTFLATFNLSSENRPVGAKNFYDTADFFDPVCSAAGLPHSILRDYNHPIDPGTPDRIYAVLRLAKD